MQQIKYLLPSMILSSKHAVKGQTNLPQHSSLQNKILEDNVETAQDIDFYSCQMIYKMT